MFSQYPFPLRFRAIELARERRWGFCDGRLRLEQAMEDSAHIAGVGPVCAFKCLQGAEAHQAGQAFLGVAPRRDGVSLQIVFHLQAVLDLAKKAIGL